jgi:hypothetical protein
MKAFPAWLVFTVLRVLMFVVPFVLLLVLGFEGWLAALLSAVIGLCLSYIFLRTPRETVARGLYEARHRDKDAAVDRASASDQDGSDRA